MWLPLYGDDSAPKGVGMPYFRVTPPTRQFNPLARNSVDTVIN